MAQLYKFLQSKSCLLLLFFMVTGASLKANTYYVDTVGDSGPGSLRAAIDSANANPGLDSIVLLLNTHDTIYIQTPLATITDSLVITGLACQNPTINGGLQLMGGSAIYSSSTTGPLTVNYINIIHCVDTVAGAKGGAVRAHQLYINNCYFAGNGAVALTGSGMGGAVYAVNAVIYNSTFHINLANNHNNNGGFGGALYISSTAGLYNCTFAGNNCAGPGGAIVADSTSLITNCTFADNAGTIGGAIFGSDSITIANSIIWNNTASTSAGELYFTGQATSGGCNVLQVTSDNFNFTVGSSDISGTNPMMDSIGYYNGCVPVIPIFCGSVAQNHASCTGATTTDAEGIPASGIRDAGAFEITPPNIGGDTIDSIPPGTTANLLALFNTQGLNYAFYGNFTDSTQVDTGTYTIVVTNSLGCTDTAIAIIRFGLDTMPDTTVSVRSIAANTGAISIFPNPAEDVVNIRFAQPVTGSLQLRVFDATGRAVMTEHITATGGLGSFNISGFATGLYMVQLTDLRGKLYAAKLNVITGK